MVMETPSPQCVGREFVRQYYTLLHEAPIHLHRFYSHDSCFVHGGVEKPGEEQPPVTGQTEIHKKIMSLSFRDCHAKIRQVDSQSTVGDAVVVQVTGELSNNGQQMRRFMQTFVLAPQSPKKYYVHNDIFRYQDEVFHDNDDSEVDITEECDVESEVENGQPVESQGEPTNFYADQPMSNGTSHVAEQIDSPPPMKETEMKEEEEIEEDKYEEEPVSKSPEPLVEDDPPAEPKPFSWAALASKKTPGGHIPPASQVTAPPKQPASQTDNKTDQNNEHPQPQRQARPVPRDRREREKTSSFSRDGREGDGDNDSLSGRRMTRYPDSHQLFVGNLPHNIAEIELKKFFEQYGVVMELRINTKSSGGKVPNFGFVVFENPDPVQHILSIKPIRFNGEHRLNVEEKKPRDGNRPNMGRGGMSRGGMNSGGMGRGSGGFNRGGMRGGFGNRNEGRGGSSMGSGRGGNSDRGGFGPTRR